jgi:hypothetical protein
MHIKLGDTWYPHGVLDETIFVGHDDGTVVAFFGGKGMIVEGKDADALRVWLAAHTVGEGDDVTAGIMPQATSGLAAAYNKLVYAMSPAHTVEHEDCQSIPVDGHYEIEYRRGEDNPYVVTSSGDPLDGYKTIEAALDYIHAQAEEAASE